MSMFTLLLTAWMLQANTDHQAIVQVANDFAKHVKSRDASKMAECIRLVCEIKVPEDKNSDAYRLSEEQFGLADCRYIIAYRDCAKVLMDKYQISLPSPGQLMLIPLENEMSMWLKSVKNCKSIRNTVVTNFKCYEYRLNYGGVTLTQRFVNILGKWYLGSPPFAEMLLWDANRNHPPVYSIASFAVTAIPMYMRTAISMAEKGKPKQEVIKFLQMYYFLPREEVEQTGSSLPVPPKP